MVLDPNLIKSLLGLSLPPSSGLAPTGAHQRLADMLKQYQRMQAQQDLETSLLDQERAATLQTQGGSLLQQIKQNLDLNRTPFSPGYGGVSRFAPKVTDQDAQNRAEYQDFLSRTNLFYDNRRRQTEERGKQQAQNLQADINDFGSRLNAVLGSYGNSQFPPYNPLPQEIPTFKDGGMTDDSPEVTRKFRGQTGPQEENDPILAALQADLDASNLLQVQTPEALVNALLRQQLSAYLRQQKQNAAPPGYGRSSSMPSYSQGSGLPRFAGGGATDGEGPMTAHLDWINEAQTPDEKRQRMASLGQTGGGGDGPRVMTEPTLVTGDSAVVPMVNPAQDGVGQGATVKMTDVLQTLAGISNPALREMFLRNIDKMDLKVMIAGGKTKKGRPQAAIASEFGQPEALLPVSYAEKGITTRRVRRNGEVIELFDDEELQEGDELVEEGGEEQKGQPTKTEEVPGGTETKGSGWPVPPPSSNPGAAPRTLPTEEGNEVEKVPPAPTEVPPPQNQGTVVSQNPEGWKIRRKPSGDWVWVGPDGKEGGVIDFQQGPPLEAYWDRVENPRDLFPQLSPEMAEWMWRSGSGHSAEAQGNLQSPVLQGQVPARVPSSPTAPERTPTSGQGPVSRPPSGSNGSGTPSGGGAGTAVSPTGSGPATGSGSPASSSSGQGQQPTTGTGGGTGTTPTQPEDTVTIGGVNVPISFLQGIRTEVQGGNTPNLQREEDRRRRIASGELSSIRTNNQNLQKLAVPTPGSTFLSQASGEVYKWERDGDGNWTLWRQSSGEERDRAYQAFGNRGSRDDEMYGWQRITSTTDINEVRQKNALVTGGYNPATEMNPEFLEHNPEPFVDGKIDAQAFRNRYEIDPGFRQTVDAALGQYETQKAKEAEDAATGRNAVTYGSREEMIAALVTRGQILNVRDVLTTGENGQAQFRSGVSFAQTSEEGQPLTGIVTLPDGRKYQYDQRQEWLVALDREGKPSLPIDLLRPFEVTPQNEDGSPRNSSAQTGGVPRDPAQNRLGITMTGENTGTAVGQAFVFNPATGVFTGQGPRQQAELGPDQFRIPARMGQPSMVATQRGTSADGSRAYLQTGNGQWFAYDFQTQRYTPTSEPTDLVPLQTGENPPPGTTATGGSAAAQGNPSTGRSTGQSAPPATGTVSSQPFGGFSPTVQSQTLGSLTLVMVNAAGEPVYVDTQGRQYVMRNGTLVRV